MARQTLKEHIATLITDELKIKGRMSKKEILKLHSSSLVNEVIWDMIEHHEIEYTDDWEYLELL